MPSMNENPHKKAGYVEKFEDLRKSGMTPEAFVECFSRASIEDIIDHLTSLSHGVSFLNGWHHDPETGEPVEHNVGERIALIHSEISEALEGHRKGKMDDHLPHRLSVEVELADALHRILDFVGKHRLDVAGAFYEKAAFNAIRADHKPENRIAQGGKSY